MFCHSPCASLADPPKLPPRRSRLDGLRMRVGASRTCRRPAPSGHPLGSQVRGRDALRTLFRAAPALGMAVVRRDHLLFAPQVHNQGLATSISILVKPMGQIRTPLLSQVAGGYTSGRRAGGAPVRKPTFRATPRGRRPGEWRQLIVSVPGRCGTVYTAPRDVFPILHCESSSGQPRGTRTACVLLLAAGAEWAFFNSQPSILYKDTLGGDTRRMCDTSGWSWRWPSVVSRATRSAESRGEARRAATLDSRRDSRGAWPTLKSSKIRCAFVL